MTDTRDRFEHLVTEMEKLDLRSVIEELHTEVQALAIRCAQARRSHFQECARLECHRCNGGMPVLVNMNWPNNTSYFHIEANGRWPCHAWKIWRALENDA